MRLDAGDGVTPDAALNAPRQDGSISAGHPKSAVEAAPAETLLTHSNGF